MKCSCQSHDKTDKWQNWAGWTCLYNSAMSHFIAWGDCIKRSAYKLVQENQFYWNTFFSSFHLPNRLLKWLSLWPAILTTVHRRHTGLLRLLLRVSVHHGERHLLRSSWNLKAGLSFLLCPGPLRGLHCCKPCFKCLSELSCHTVNWRLLWFHCLCALLIRQTPGLPPWWSATFLEACLELHTFSPFKN